MTLAETSNIIKVWINEDSKQPSRFRYFTLQGHLVTLTAMGKSLATGIQKKLGQTFASGKDAGKNQ
jgi:hypothetical protein